MTTYTAITTHPERLVAEKLALAMERLTPEPMGVAYLEIEDGSENWEIAGYFKEPPNEIELLLICAAHQVSPFVISKLDDRDWVAQVRRELTPVRAGHFLVHGRHDRERLFPSDIGIEIEAAMAFGTGHHGTTLGCLELTEKLYNEGFTPRYIADIGTGTGILAMAAGKRWPSSQILASDIETISVATARANFNANGVHQIRVVQSVGFHSVLHREKAPFDLIYANILAGPLRKLAPEMSKNLANGGQIILSGILRRQARGVLNSYEAFGFTLIEKNEIGEWVSLLLKRV